MIKSRDEVLQLPIVEHQEEIIDGIQHDRVLVICGKTGCGKSTQVPKFIFQKWPDSKIAVCEPRRLAATALAHRVAHQLSTTPGNTVGYQIGMDSKISDKTSICFMTYGILIQQLLFRQDITYTHIILDEVHERSLDMDFTFIALRKILDQKAASNIKLVIMSATINSKQFRRYFSTHKQTKKFLKPSFRYFTTKETGGFRRGSRHKNVKKLGVEIEINDKEFEECRAIELPDKNKYNITEYYAEDFQKGKRIINYHADEDARVADCTFDSAVMLIQQQRNDNANGDILIFVPGMQEIQNLKKLILKSLNVSAQCIVEVHSAYSEELYHRLFSEKIKNKIIIATNIGESSITLPFCKTVIDFCLTRKNITSESKGYSKFETRIASKANLLQRAGRVGRTSDGTVYRLISKAQFNRLAEFDVPEIKCVSLGMVILKAKQIDKTCHSTLFEDPYDVFLNAIEPPSVQEIHETVKYLLQEQALVNASKKQQRKEQKYDGESLKLSSVGEFMVAMPCSMRITKMIILSIEFGIVTKILGIVSIMMNQKKFFIHEELMENVEEFMHSIIGYDGGKYNDFVLRERIFSHWKRRFYDSFCKDRGYYGLYQEKARKKQSKSNQIGPVEQFCGQRFEKDEKFWCRDRGISSFNMREILRISEDLKDRLLKMNIELNQAAEEDENQLILICLSIAFEDTTCNVSWKQKQVPKKGQKIENYVSVISSNVTNESDLYDYVDPQEYPLVEYKQGGLMTIKGNNAIISKFMLPNNYSKANLKATSKIFQYLASSPLKVSYTYESATVSQRMKAITILNQSINRFCIRPIPHQQYMLIADQVFESKGNYYISECALVEKKLLILVKMITVKQVELQLHASEQFYYQVRIGDDLMELPFFISNTDLETILDTRMFALWDKNRTIDQNPEQKANKEKVMQLVRGIEPRPKMEPWNFIFDSTKKGYDFVAFEPELISECRGVSGKLTYFQEYQDWKISYQKDLYYNFKTMTAVKSSIICSACYPQYLTMIDDLQAYKIHKGTLELNQYRGSWIKRKETLYCIRNHYLGKIINEDEADLEFQRILMYGPYDRTEQFTGGQSIDQFIAKEAEGLKKQEKRKREIDVFECKICATYNDYEGLSKCIFNLMNDSERDRRDFWKKISSHMYSKMHLDNADRFLDFSH